MNEIDRIINCCGYDDELFRTYITCLLQLKKCSEMFGQIQMQLRNDYLIRGICEREVDEVVREVRSMKHIFFLKRYSGIS